MIEDKYETELREVMDKYGTMVSAISHAQLSCRSEADDVFQDVFLLYFTKEIHFENESARKSWLIRTTINLCRRANRSPWSRGSSEETDSIADESTVKTVEENEVWNAVRELKQKYFLPVYLYYFENMPIAEIANTLNINSGTVQMRLVRARKMLRAKLRKGEYFNEE